MRLSPTLLVLCLAVGSACRPAPVTDSENLADSTRRALLAVDSAYVAGWLADDPDGVMQTLAQDATIVPDGMEPIRGDSAIRAYWWPDDGSETRVTDYDTSVRDIGGSATVAYLLGDGALNFDWRPDSSEAWESYASRSVWIALLRRGPDGRWRMTHRMWHRVDR